MAARDSYLTTGFIKGLINVFTGGAGVVDDHVRETMQVDPGHIAMYEPSVNYDIQRVKGVKNILFGGEGLFLASLTGPGRIWLQSLPLANLASKLMQYMPVKTG